MPASYSYKARDKFGRPITGLMSADSEGAIAIKLNQMGYLPVAIKKAKEDSGWSSLLDRFARIRFSDLNMFTRQLATMQKASLPILLSLGALRDQTTNKAFAAVIERLLRDIEGGASLSGALEKYPKIFSPLYVSMIRAGETGGLLEQILERLATLGEHEEMVRMRIKSATRYPLIIVVAMLIGFLVLTTFVVPRFASLYSQFSVALPLPTRVLLWLHYAITKFWLIYLLLAGISLYAFHKFINNKLGRFWWDTLKLRVPVFGPLVLKLSMSRFARITGTLMRSGVPILKILELASAGAGNVAIARTIDHIKESVTEGKGMSEPMKIASIFPPTVIQMVAVGENTGKLDELLLHVSNHYDAQVDYTINNLTSLIEPFLIFVLGCGVLFMALGIFLPMWNLMSLFRR